MLVFNGECLIRTVRMLDLAFSSPDAGNVSQSGLAKAGTVCSPFSRSHKGPNSPVMFVLSVIIDNHAAIY